ncbi:MAG: NAD-dependent epimerase/dehydratase family protein, partial [Chloroflexi bacterium]|nr:NAD-dependent epimerase/dehydratase family protein [Chloroflexota bacterium]
MKILVTGGAGFIGSHVVDRFIAEGHDVVVVDNLSTGRRANLNPKATFYEMDLRSPQLAEVFERERPEAIDHHAAQAEVRRSVADPVFDAEVNILGSLNLLQNAAKYGVRKAIYISSGGAIYGEPEYMPCDEKHPVRPMSPYGVTKHTVEHYLYLYKQLHGLDYTVLRYANVYGPRQDPNGEAGVVAIFVGQMLNGGKPIIYGDGRQERDFVYVADCARANALALTRGEGEAFNIGSGVPLSVNGLFELLKQITGYAGEARYGSAKAGDILRIYLDASKAKRELGWEPTVS